MSINDVVENNVVDEDNWDDKIRLADTYGGYSQGNVVNSYSFRRDIVGAVVSILENDPSLDEKEVARKVGLGNMNKDQMWEFSSLCTDCVCERNKRDDEKAHVEDQYEFYNNGNKLPDIGKFIFKKSLLPAGIGFILGSLCEGAYRYATSIDSSFIGPRTYIVGGIAGLVVAAIAVPTIIYNRIRDLKERFDPRITKEQKLKDIEESSGEHVQENIIDFYAYN